MRYSIEKKRKENASKRNFEVRGRLNCLTMKESLTSGKRVYQKHKTVVNLYSSRKLMEQ